MKRNLLLIKITSTLANSWFWLGIWLLYYLSITDFKGVGIIEAVAFTNGLIMEIPTGAISDLIGKKKSLIIGYALMGSGNILMGFSHTLPLLILSVFILGPGYGLVSGTKEALIYDSLKEIKKEKLYEASLADINKFQLIGLAIASILGGFLYSINTSLPYLMTGGFMLAASIISFNFSEPSIDTERFSFKSFLKQNTLGIESLKRTIFKKRFFLLILVFAAFSHLIYQVYDSALAIEFGFNEQQLGIFFALATLASAVGSHYYIRIKKKTGLHGLYFLLLGTLAITILVSPFAGLMLGGSTIMIREFFNKYADILATDSINKSTLSSVRATTISTYYMLVGLPYAISAYFIGGLIDRTSASISAVILFCGFTLISIFIYGLFAFKKSREQRI